MFSPHGLLILCIVGDFGLATSSLAAVDPSDVSTNLYTDGDMTLGKHTWHLQFSTPR